MPRDRSARCSRASIAFGNGAYSASIAGSRRTLVTCGSGSSTRAAESWAAIMRSRAAWREESLFVGFVGFVGFVRFLGFKEPAPESPENAGNIDMGRLD